VALPTSLLYAASLKSDLVEILNLGTSIMSVAFHFLSRAENHVWIESCTHQLSESSQVWHIRSKSHSQRSLEKIFHAFSQSYVQKASQSLNAEKPQVNVLLLVELDSGTMLGFHDESKVSKCKGGVWKHP